MFCSSKTCFACGQNEKKERKTKINLDKIRLKNQYLHKKSKNTKNLKYSKPYYKWSLFAGAWARPAAALPRIKGFDWWRSRKVQNNLNLQKQFYIMFKNIFKTCSKTVFHIPIKLSGDHFVYLKWGITVMIDGEISKHFRKFSKWSNPITGAVS